MGNAQGKKKRSKNNGLGYIDRPSSPGAPEILNVEGYNDLESVTLRWDPPVTDGGSAIEGYIIEKRELYSDNWVVATPIQVKATEFQVRNFKPGCEYQFRISAVNANGLSKPSPSSEPVGNAAHTAVTANGSSAPRFIRELRNTVILQYEKVDMLVEFRGFPLPRVTWYRNGLELWGGDSKTEVRTVGEKSCLVIRRAAISDEGEIKCVAINDVGRAETRARLIVEAPPTIQIPRQYAEGLLFESGEMIRLKVGYTGKPRPEVEWYHEGVSLKSGGRCEIEQTDEFSCLKILDTRRDDRGEYVVRIENNLGEEVAPILVTITDRPQPPSELHVKDVNENSCVLEWTPPLDDGGCKIGNYIVEYFRVGWNVWLKAVTSRNPSAKLSDLILGSEYLFRVKAENPFGISEPSEECGPVFFPDPKRGILEPVAPSATSPSEDFVMVPREASSSPPVAPPRNRKRVETPPSPGGYGQKKSPSPAGYSPNNRHRGGSAGSDSEFVLVLMPDAANEREGTEKAESPEIPPRRFERPRSRSPPQVRRPMTQHKSPELGLRRFGHSPSPSPPPPPRPAHGIADIIKKRPQLPLPVEEEEEDELEEEEEEEEDDDESGEAQQVVSGMFQIRIATPVAPPEEPPRSKETTPASKEATPAVSEAESEDTPARPISLSSATSSSSEEDLRRKIEALIEEEEEYPSYRDKRSAGFGPLILPMNRPLTLPVSNTGSPANSSPSGTLLPQTASYPPQTTPTFTRSLSNTSSSTSPSSRPESPIYDEPEADLSRTPVSREIQRFHLSTGSKRSTPTLSDTEENREKEYKDESEMSEGSSRPSSSLSTSKIFSLLRSPSTNQRERERHVRRVAATIINISLVFVVGRYVLSHMYAGILVCIMLAYSYFFPRAS